MTSKLLINCDMGEGLANDESLMPYIDMVNISCGAHAGSLSTVLDTIVLAEEHQKSIGAHPGYEDKENFGRVEHNWSPERIIQSIEMQLDVFNELAEQVGVTVNHVKLHGAMYHRANQDIHLFTSVCELVAKRWPKCHVVANVDEKKRQITEALGLRLLFEGFLDRGYQQDGYLVARGKPNAVIEDEHEVVQRAHDFLQNARITSVEGHTLCEPWDTWCVHGDNPNALNILKSLHRLTS